MKNLLPDSQNTKDYEKWMKGKPLHSLRCILSIYKVDLEMDRNRYTNLPTRIALITKEIERREKLNIPDTIAQHDSVVNGIRNVCEVLIQD